MIRRSSKLPARPLAVLEVINKRGRGVFNEHDEEALVRLCACVESLLRRKAAEVALLWSGLTERSLIRKSNSCDGGGGDVATSNSARFERAMMRLYSEAAPVDGASLGEHRALGGADSASGDGGRKRAVSDSSSSNPKHADEEDDDFLRRRDGSGSVVLDGVVGCGEGGRTPDGGGGGGVDRTLSEERAREELELVDLSNNLFDLSSGQLLSLVVRFFRNMGLMEKFQVNMTMITPFPLSVGWDSAGPLHDLSFAVSGS